VLPFLGVELVIFFYFVVDAFGIGVGDVFADDLQIVLGEGLLNLDVYVLTMGLLGLRLHIILSNQMVVISIL
jgi:hypothetical protein